MKQIKLLNDHAIKDPNNANSIELNKRIHWPDESTWYRNTLNSSPTSSRQVKVEVLDESTQAQQGTRQVKLNSCSWKLNGGRILYMMRLFMLVITTTIIVSGSGDNFIIKYKSFNVSYLPLSLSIGFNPLTLLDLLLFPLMRHGLDKIEKSVLWWSETCMLKSRIT